MIMVVAIVTVLVGPLLLLFGPRRRHSWAAVLSWIAPGSGHIIIGQYRRGVFWTVLFVFWTLCLKAVPLVALVALLLIRVAAAVDAFVISSPPSGLPSWRKAFPRVIVFGMLATLWLAAHPISEHYMNNGGGMRNALIAGDYFLVESFPALKLERGDVVLHFAAGRDRPGPVIGRIVGLGGDFVETGNNRFYINGKLLDEPYLHGASSTNQPTSCYGCSQLTVPSGAYFVVGDNRGYSGPLLVKRDEIKGRVFLRYWSWDPQLGGLRLERIGRVF